MSPRTDPRRYRKLLRFLAGVFVHALWWEVLLARRGLRFLRRDPVPRWTAIARRFRGLAVEMGGVLIKLGQFLSTRVDLLPREITDELGGLQDEVPPAPFDAVVAQVEEDFGRPLDDVFARFESAPLGAASLAQVYRAELAGGQEVVVKVLRPGIDVLVETDLKAIALGIRGLRLFRFVRRRVDLGRLAEEFVRTTRKELDMPAEGRHAERFAECFAGDRGVLVPRVYWRQTAARTLTLENVGFVKIGDLAALDAAGVDRAQVAKRLWSNYLQQIVEHNFVHADPHPGNLFVKPLPGKGAGPLPFQLAFVDFGMVAVIPDRLRAALREYVIALGTRDAYRIVQAYQQAGVLLPGADLKRLEEAHEAVFERFWGVRIGDLRDLALKEMGSFWHEYRDLIRDYPFQAQVDLLFVQRSIGILIGMVTGLDPDFDLWAATRPFAAKLAREGQSFPQGDWLPELVTRVRTSLALPGRFDRLLTDAERGNLGVRAGLAPDARKALGRLEHAVARLAWVVVAVGLLVCGSLFYVNGASPRVGGAVMVAGGLLLAVTLLRRGA